MFTLLVSGPQDDSFSGEEMGLGKTVEIAALVLSNPAPQPEQPEQETTDKGHLVSR